MRALLPLVLVGCASPPPARGALPAARAADTATADKLDPSEADEITLYGRDTADGGDVVSESKDATDTAGATRASKGYGGDLEPTTVVIDDGTDKVTATLYWFDNGEDPAQWQAEIVSALPATWSAAFVHDPSFAEPSVQLVVTAPDGARISGDEVAEDVVSP